jgi:hypothetical protein
VREQVILGFGLMRLVASPTRSGGLSESEAVDSLGMRDYIWRHPRGNYIQESWFDLGNPGLLMYPSFNLMPEYCGDSLH